jgi:2-polyprenyl-3-methyl-5-hydroxy-6-metoxy-1,4-benzoquinol methylase
MHHTSHNERFWREFYAKGHTNEPSLFAKHCIKYLQSGMTIADVGCGNGRDAIYFAKMGWHVHAFDACHEAIAQLNETLIHLPKTSGRVTPVVSVVRNLPAMKFDVIYARFFIHAIDAHDEYEFLRWVEDCIQPGGYLMLEMRTVRDPLCPMRTAYHHHESMEGHYRRFQNPVEWLRRLYPLDNPSLIEFHIGQDLAPYQRDNPEVLRIVLQYD